MTTTPEIAHLSPADLLALKTAIDERLAEIRQQHIAAAQALGLTLVDGNEPAKRKKRNSTKQHEQA